jgi:DNA-binding protein HU-beta
MTKADLIDAVAEAAGEGLSKKAVGEIVDATMDALKDAVREGRFSYPGFGTFSVKEAPAREGRNPRSGETIQIAASKRVNFKAAPKFKDSL